jgi:thioredoxin 1
MKRETVAAALGAVLTLGALAGAAQAAEPVPWSQSKFEAAQNAGKSIVLDVTAAWCPICASQAPTLATLEKMPEFAEVVVFSIDFDSQKDAVRQFRVPMQSTLIAFKGKKEEARSTGATDPKAIRAVFERAL